MAIFNLTLYEPLSLQQFNFSHTINSYYTFIKYDLITISEHTFVTMSVLTFVISWIKFSLVFYYFGDISSLKQGKL